MKNKECFRIVHNVAKNRIQEANEVLQKMKFEHFADACLLDPSKESFIGDVKYFTKASVHEKIKMMVWYIKYETNFLDEVIWDLISDTIWDEIDEKFFNE